MAKLNPSTLAAGILGGWCCLWPLGWACSWSIWWVDLALAFFLGTSLLFGWTFLRVECSESDG